MNVLSFSLGQSGGFSVGVPSVFVIAGECHWATKKLSWSGRGHLAFLQGHGPLKGWAFEFGW